MKMPAQFHESLERAEAHALPSEQSFARVMAGACYVLAVIGWWRGGNIALLVIIGSGFLATGYLKPEWLAPLNRAWAKFGAVLFKFTNPIVMFAMYAVAILPMGLLMRALGKDPLKRTFDAKAQTYWITRDIAGPPPESMRRQF